MGISTRAWQIWRYLKGQWHEDILDLHARYGPLVRIGPNAVSMLDATHGLRTIYGHGTKATKTDWYLIWNSSGRIANTSFSEIDVSEHSRKRKQVAKAYAMTSILKMEEYIQGAVDLSRETFAQCIEEASKSEAVLDMAIYTQAFAFDVLGEIGFGGSFDLLKTRGQGESKSIVEAIDLSFLVLANSGYLPGKLRWLKSNVIRVVCKLFNVDLSKLQQLFKVTQYAEEMVLKRQQEKASRTDLLQQFIDSKTSNGDPLDQRELLGEVVSLLGAGADTSAIGIRSVLGSLLVDRAGYTKLTHEIDSFYVTQNLEGREIKYTECLELPYLQAVVKEGLRMHPSIQFQLPRSAPEGGVTICNAFVPGGTEISMSPLASNRDKAVFGKDADIWNPERWLESNERSAWMDKHLVTFGYGARSCLGKNIALVEINLYIVQLLRHFKLEIANPSQPWTVHTCWSSSQRDMFMKITKRNW
ncbi:Cytochrome P450 E-class group I [Penicillium concentricum]|uniref:Cytochrome P450 E-class group I n=1 Tax=Penicillium concentricum TaxID=293559 RepID=A0A9W9V9Z0_9EURO|nr:Cytochrome P450 E-class group I [Penicillium concentricum]KAJ5371830.1 Cytochrome P450 E-class group I [Penicillium concentricum]